MKINKITMILCPKCKEEVRVIGGYVAIHSIKELPDPFNRKYCSTSGLSVETVINKRWK